MARSERAATDFKEQVMSQMISRRSDGFQMQARSATPLGEAGEILMAVPRALVRAARRAWKTHTDERLLQELSDHQLRDIGIRRAHIPHIVRHGLDI
jgi:uncharacterized protein YjiS (DUF1127 family)